MSAVPLSLLLLAAACDGGTASRPPAVRPAPVRTTGGACLGYHGLDKINPASEVRAGRFRTPDAPPVRVAHGTDVDWGLNPHRDRTWQLWFNSLEWLGGLIKHYERTRDRADLALATGIVRDWLADNEPAGGRLARGFTRDRLEAIEEGTKFRLAALTCLRDHTAGGWLDTAIARNAGWLAHPRHWSGPWNHGTDESMILLSAGCRIGRGDLAATGYGRLVGAVLRPPGGARPAIDAQGANNEQSTHYSIYNRGRWRRAIEIMRACGRPVPAELARRHALMDEFIAFQATPDGDLLQIGESHAGRLSRVSRQGNGPIRYAVSQGTAGTRPAARARVYEAGYVMGRSGWGDGARPFREEMAYTARFGPGRYAHGQEDHMALTFYAQGRDVLVPSGHIGYNESPWRDWLRSPDAQNTVVVRGVRFRQGTPTALTRHRLEKGGDFFRFSDTAYTGSTRNRSVLAASDPDALVVLDHVRSGSPHTVEQLWHLPPDYAATPVGKNAVATAGRVRVHFLRVAVPARGGRAAAPAVVVKGSTPRGHGWIVPRARTAIPAPVVKLASNGADVRMITVVAPVRGGARPRVRSYPPGRDGTYRIEAVISGHRLVVDVAKDGTLRRRTG